MPAPALVKSWQFSVDNLIPVDTGSAAVNAKQMLAFKNALLGFGSNPMTVIGSSDGSTSGMDATDRWSAYTNLVQNSWIVLQDAQVNPKFQICFHLTGTGWVTNVAAATVQITVSRLAGFGTANGGTDGTTSARPTATDEDAKTGAALSTSATNVARRFYVWRSTDGQVTRAAFRNATAGSWEGWWEWGKPRVPRTLWTDPCYYRFGFLNSGLPSPWLIGTTNLQITAYKGSTKLTDINTHIAGPFGTGNSQSFPTALNQNNDWESPTDYDTYRLYLNSPSVAGSRGGIIGELFDLRTAPPAVTNGTRFPDTAPFTWIALSESATIPWIVPWNDTVGKFGVAP